MAFAALSKAVRRKEDMTEGLAKSSMHFCSNIPESISRANSHMNDVSTLGCRQIKL